MAEYHVGCGNLGSAIYAGTLNKKKDMWLHKSDVTAEAIEAVRDYFLLTMGDGSKQTGYEWERKDGAIVQLVLKIKEPK